MYAREQRGCTNVGQSHTHIHTHTHTLSLSLTLSLSQVFSADGRWLISASLDCTIRTWDLVSGQLVDWFRVPSAATSLTFAPTSEFLATTHLGDLGIYLWANKHHFSSILLMPPPEVPSTAVLPRAEKLNVDSRIASATDADEADEADEADILDTDSDAEIDTSDDDNDGQDDGNQVAASDKANSIDNKRKKRTRQTSSSDAADVDDDDDDDRDAGDADVNDQDDGPAAKRARAEQFGDMVTLSGVPMAQIKTLVNLDLIKVCIATVIARARERERERERECVCVCVLTLTNIDLYYFSLPGT
jgi:hypothetical protein